MCIYVVIQAALTIAKGSLKTRLRSIPRIKHAGEAAGVDARV